LVDTLKHAVEEFAHSPVQVLGAVVAIGGAISAAFKNGRRFWLNLWARLRSKPVVPTETIRLVQNVHNSFWSGNARIGDTPAMQVSFDGYVTDISGRSIRILRAEVPKPRTEASMLLISNDHDARRPQTLEPYESADIHASFFVQPVVGEKGKPWRSAVIFIDQYGNRHKVKNAVFRPMETSQPSAPKEREEFPYEIADPIEKEVVSVLKAEIARYAICGRTVGGLGSVYLVYRGRAFAGGWPTDSWTPNSTNNQMIVPDPETAEVKSDNLDALLSFYGRLSGEDERATFANALLNRLDEKAGYLVVSYFIVAVLWRTGFLSEALRKARRSLPENEHRAFGLSNVLMLLNGLLRYRHPDFSGEMLDEIERMLNGLEEHPFLIPTKLAAIRAHRLQRAEPQGLESDIGGQS
jgi:hypothetical protein